MSLIVNTLGRLDIRWDGQPVPDLSLRKSQALLIYLALTPGSHDRGRLAGLLWGDLPKRNARRNLRHALHGLRRSLDPDIFVSDRLSAGLNPAISIQMDALDFEAAIARAKRCQREGEPTAAVDHLERAVDLYQGDFLAGFAIADCLAFEEWAARRRVHMREQFLEALDSLVAHWTRHGHYERALRYARRQLALEPLWEKSHRQMMTLLALTGQRSAALAQYRECRRVLKEELGLEPLEETTALYGELVDGEIGRPVDGEIGRLGDEDTSLPIYQSTNLPISQPPTLLFTGRGEERATLMQWWEAAQRNVRRLTLVAGVAGVGKTRLVDEVIHVIKPQGAVVLRGHCYEFGGGLPYQPIVGALRDYLNQGADQPTSAPLPLHSLDPVWLVELSHLLPDLRRAFPDLPNAQPIAGEGARQRLFEAVARLLRAICDERSALCLFLDDLHWADQSTLDLLHYLIRHLEGVPAWIVGTYRPEEVGLSHPLTRLRQGLSRDQRVDRLALKPLSDGAVRTLARSLVGERDGATLGDFLYRESEGNPFILGETVSALEEEGALVTSASDAEGAPWVWTGAPLTETLPLRVQDIILQRVGRLSEPAQQLLTLASIVGQPFDADLLRAAAGRDADRVEESLDEWLARRLIQQPPTSRRPSSTPHPPLRYDFSHSKIRAAVYHTIGPGRRRKLHRRVGEALEQLFSDQLDQYSGVLAYHWEQAAVPERSMDYLLRAGDQARLVYAHQEAIDYYRRALAILEEQGEVGRETRARTLMKLGLAYHDGFDYREARRAYEAGFELWQQVGEHRAATPLPPAPHPLRVRWLEPTTMDPTMSPDSHTSALMSQLFSGLVALSPQMSIVPDVAYAWDVSEDGRRYIFHLRDDVRWSDGVPVTAGDFEYAWKRTLAPDSGSPSAGYLHAIRGAEAFHRGDGSRDAVGVCAEDEVTLAVTLEEPTGYFLQLLVRPDYYPVPRHVVEAQGTDWTELAHFVTNGPFRLERWQPGERLVLRRNPDYHGRFQGNVEQVELFPRTDWSTRLQMYTDDALDVLGITFFPSDKREMARQRHADECVSWPILETCYLVFDVSRPPFDDARVRRAFALSTDRQAMAEVATEGHAAAATGGLLPPGMPGHSPAIGLPYDPERARRLLAEAGYPEGRGFPAVDALAFQAVEGRMSYLGAQWRGTLGVEVTWRTPAWAAFLDQLRNERHHILCVMWVADYPDPDNFMRVSRAEVWSHWRDERYDSLVAEAGRVMDQEERMALYRQADELLVAEAPILPLLYERRHLLIKPWVRHYPITASRAIFWKDVILEPHEPGGLSHRF